MELSGYQMLKFALLWTTGLSRDALHIYVGLGVLLVSAALMRRPLGSLLPWLAVLAAACAGEALDLRDDLRTMTTWAWQASAHDLWNTLFWPTVLTLLARAGVLARLLGDRRET